MPPDDEPSQQAPGTPADPFGPMHANYVAILEMVRNFRRAGGGLIESSVMVAAQIAVNAAGGEGKPDA